MESESNLGDNFNDGLDDLEISKVPPTFKTPMSKSSANTKNARIDGKDVGGQAKKGKVSNRATTSDVWNHYEKIGVVDGVEKCKCNGCSKLYTCSSGAGTNHLRRHIQKCISTPKFHDIGALIDNQATLLKKWKFDSVAYREALAKCIIKHDLPFSYAEYEGVVEVNRLLNPEFKPITRNTTKLDCFNVYLIEKARLKSELAALPGRVCLTSDVWTAVNVRGYMSLTVHYVDANWKLNSKLLAFIELDCQHTGVELAGKIFKVLKDWEIESKIFSITLDNASNNDRMQENLVARLELQNGLLCKGEFFHIRCCAHILNLIVQAGIKEVNEPLSKIRESVKYVKGSEGRLRQFHKCVSSVNLSDVGGSFLRLDVSTRWNSTYMMLASAIKYRRAFTSMSYDDSNYKCCPTNEEWERAERICDFLEPFYNITNLISGSSYSTSNLYFMQVAMIEMKLNENLKCEDQKIRDMATKMKAKFDKYWNEYSVTLALGCVLDPSAKLEFLSYCYGLVYSNHYQEKVDKVKRSLYKLFDEYMKKYGGSSSSQVNSSHDVASQAGLSGTTSFPFCPAVFTDFHNRKKQMISNDGKSQLDIYMEEGCIAIDAGMNALEYWKVNKHRFPQLAIMACDILSIPITTVASESSFSIGGRILHKYRSCLLGENVQALICTRSWLHGFKEIGPSDVPETEEIQFSLQDSNIIIDDDE